MSPKNGPSFKTTVRFIFKVVFGTFVAIWSLLVLGVILLIIYGVITGKTWSMEQR